MTIYEMDFIDGYWLETAWEVLGCEWRDRSMSAGECVTHLDVWPCSQSEQAARIIEQAAKEWAEK